MKTSSILLLFILVISGCSTSQKLSKEKVRPSYYVWTRGFHQPSQEAVQKLFTDLKTKGIDGIIYAAGKKAAPYELAGKIAKEIGLEFYALLPALVQYKDSGLDKSVYMINGLGDSTYDKPSFHKNHFVCPNKPAVYDYLEDIYGTLLDIPEVDGIQLDVIRFPDVILAPALWKKYNLVMDQEYPKFDYCYCDKCVSDFKKLTGIDIKKVKNPATIPEWKQFRYDVLTKLVNHLAQMAHNKNKKINAAVFPGPNSIAKKIVRQEWDKWNLDAFFPMNYNDFYLKNTEWLGEICKESVKAVNAETPILSGLFICPNPENKDKETDPENFGLLPEELAAAITNSVNNGATGICLFTANRMTEAHWEIFERVRASTFIYKKK